MYKCILYTFIFIFVVNKFKIMKKLLILTSFLTFVFSNQMQSQQKFNTVEQPEWTKNAVIYEVNTRQFSESGKLSEVTQQLERIKNLGVDIVWIMPVQPIGKINRKGELGSYYSISNYTEVNPEFGTLQDFKDLVNKAHQLGMKVILDWVANHTAWDNVWVKEHPEFYTADNKGNRPIVTLDDKGKPTDWDDTADLDYNNKNLRNAMIDAMKFWMTNANLDGFRCDVAGFVPIDFWVQARTELSKIKTIFMLAEWDSPETHKAFNMTYGWQFKNLMIDIEKGKKNFSDITTYQKETAKKFNLNDLIMYFTTNHDLNSWDGTEYQLFGKNVNNYAVLTYCMGGMPLIYNGQEAGLNKKLEFFKKDPIQWGNYSKTDFYKNLNTIYKNNSAFWNGIYRAKFELINNKGKYYAFRLVSNKNTARVYQNYSEEDLVISANQLPENKKDLLSNKLIEAQENKFILPPHSSWIFIE